MKISRDISTKKHGTMTRIMIWKKSVNEDVFTKTIHKYLCKCGYSNCHCEKGYFIWQIQSSRNFKYLCRKNVAEAEVLFNEFRREYFEKMEG